nr:chemokine XC receptor 1-like [Cavia porcellus]
MDPETIRMHRVSLLSVQMESWETPEPTAFVDYDLQIPLCENEDIGSPILDNVILYSLVLLLSLVGNSLVLGFLVKYKSFKSLTKLFLLNLCLSDLESSFLLLVWVSIEHWSLVLCKAVRMIFSVSLYNNVFFLTIMTVHQYLSEVRPQCVPYVHSLRSLVLLATAMWVPSILSAIPNVIFYEVIDDQCAYSGTKGLLVSVYMLNFMFLLSMVTICFCYGQTLRTLLHFRSRWHHRLIFTIVVAYVLSCAPYNLILFLQTLVNLRVIQSCKTRQQLDQALFVFQRLAFAQWYFRPVYYGLFVQFRTYLRNGAMDTAFTSAAPEIPPQR